MLHLVLAIVASDGLKVHLELAWWAFIKCSLTLSGCVASFSTFLFVIVFYIDENVRFRSEAKAK